MYRLILLLGCLAAIGIGTGALESRAADKPIGGGGTGQLTYKQPPEMGLQCRRPVEFAFVERVVAMVDAGQLPRPLVDSTFGWARKKPSRKIQYFEFALRARAQKIGVEL